MIKIISKNTIISNYIYYSKMKVDGGCFPVEIFVLISNLTAQKKDTF